MEAFLLTLQHNFDKVSSPPFRMTADYSSIFYLGSNGVDVRDDIYSIYFEPPTDYQRLFEMNARYALVFSSLLA